MDSPFFFEGTTYWSLGDERSHFEWMDRIACVRGVHGRGRRVFLDIDPAAVTQEDGCELYALYRRYGGDAAQLKLLGISLEGSVG